MPVLVCIDTVHVSSAWVTIDDAAVATPNDFNANVTHVEKNSQVVAGRNKLAAIVASKTTATLFVRVLANPGGTNLNMMGSWRDGKPNVDVGALNGVGGEATLPTYGCATGGAGLT